MALPSLPNPEGHVVDCDQQPARLARTASLSSWPSLRRCWHDSIGFWIRKKELNAHARFLLPGRRCTKER